ncbi:AbrB/MazE/SpoVT family DNA-binding domain-containing protein, partial [Methanosphaera sp.]|uniref:AbrB/MazE/SpoVT family DNA-binding domain-containing protein n=1 Tax=Methanosphaera sp. TaxID=2666342 RepID=UPI002E75DBFC
KLYKSIKVSKNNQISIPSEFRKLLNIQAGDNIALRDVEEGILITNEKKVTEKDIIGLIKEEIPYNSVEIKKRGSKGLKW